MPWEAPREPWGASRVTSRRSALEEAGEPRSVIGPLLGLLITTGVLGAAGWYGYKTYFEKDVCRSGAYETCVAACDGGDGASCLTLAEMVEKGEGVEADPKRAVSLLTRGCESGSADACYRAAQAFDMGRGVARDRQRAATLYRQGCDAGNEDACKKRR
jgi:TPR repeat protein